MKIILINPPSDNTISTNVPEFLEQDVGFIPPLGLMYIAAYIEKYTNNTVKIIDCRVEKMDYETLKEELHKEQPDVVGVTTLTFTLIDVIKTLKIVKNINPDIKTVLGGPHVNIYPEETVNIPEVDFVVLGEGEAPFKDLIDNINDLERLKTTQGLAFKDKNGNIHNTGCRTLLQDLDKLPFPARHLTPYKKYYSVLAKKSPVTSMFTSRGCPFKCLFCDRPHLGKMFRARSAKNVVDEMQQITEMGIKEIFIYDDTFTVNRQRVVDICQEIFKRNLQISWDIRARVDTVDEELLKLMKKAGCARIHYGVEAGTERVLKILRKGITLDQVKKAFALTKKQGIYNLGYFMIGAPTETREEIEQTIKLAKKLKPNFVHFAILTPYPATAVYNLGLEQKVLPFDYWQKFAQNPTKDFRPYFWEKELSREELVKLLKKAYVSFYFRPNYIIKQIRELESFREFLGKIHIAFKLLLYKIKFKK